MAGKPCESCEKWAERYERLVQEMVSLRRDGFSPPSAVTAPAPAPQLETEIVAAINTVAFDSFTRRELYKKAHEDKAAGIPIEEIAKRIEAGEEIPT